MNDPEIQANSIHDDRLHELIEEFTHRIAEGELMSVDEFARNHPKYSEKLSLVLPTIKVLHDLSESPSTDFSSEPERCEKSSEPISKTLGDFRIIREIGRGGMGVVYEAEQISIGRRVAVKVLAFAEMLDKQQLNRFRNEVRAAGTVDHPNIVSVHAVGNERGVHYYAMQYIDGQSVAELIQQLRGFAGLPNFLRFPSAVRSESALEEKNDSYLDDFEKNDNSLERLQTEDTPQRSFEDDTQAIADAYAPTLSKFDFSEHCQMTAKLGLQVAEALEHAHQNGVLHRDVKPANLLLDRDGKLYVTDFGLARVQSGLDMSATGDVIGTLRYMSPEQARGERKILDERSDIYSVGVTLFELVSLRPAFPKQNRVELLKSIYEDEPAFSREIKRRMPSELETIITTAMSKDANDRYENMEALADDLRRFLNTEPILAKLPGPCKRTAKWLKRHQKLSWFLLIAAFLLALGATIVRNAQQEASENLDLATILADVLVKSGSGSQLSADRVLLRETLSASIDTVEQLVKKSPNDEIVFALAKLYLARAENSFILGEDGSWDIEQGEKLVGDLRVKRPTDERLPKLLDQMHLRLSTFLVNDMQFGKALQQHQHRVSLVNNPTLDRKAWRHGSDCRFNRFIGRLDASAREGRYAWGFAKELEQQEGPSACSFFVRREFAITLMESRNWDELMVLAADTKSLLARTPVVDQNQYYLWQWQRANAKTMLARVENLRANPSEALRIIDDVMTQLSLLLGRQTSPGVWIHRLSAEAKRCQSDAFTLKNNYVEAEEAIRESLEHLRHCRDRFDVYERAINQARLGHLLLIQGKQDAVYEFTSAINQLQAICKELPKESYCHRGLLALISTCPVSSIRERYVELSLEICQRFQESTQGNPTFLRFATLAHVVAGQPADATLLIDNFSTDSDLIDQSIVAIVHQANGDADAADETYRNAVQALSEQTPMLFDIVGPIVVETLKSKASQ